jgi:hypothetical protein
MVSRENFWSELHLLTRAMEAQGDDPSKRIAVAFDSLSPVAKGEVQRDLAFVISELQAVHSSIRLMSAIARRQSPA